MRTERMTLARMALLIEGLQPEPKTIEYVEIEPLTPMPTLSIQPKAWQNKYENIGKR